MGYHVANNLEGSQEDSWASINEGLMAHLQQVQLANNTSAKATNDSVYALTVETRELRAELAQTQQQLAMITRSPVGAPPANPPTWPHVQASPHSQIPPPPPACKPIPYAPTAYPPVWPNIYQPTPHTTYGHGGRQRRTCGRGRGGRTRNEGKSTLQRPQCHHLMEERYQQPILTVEQTPNPTPTKTTTIGTCVFLWI